MELNPTLEKKYSYADYLTWADGVRKEILDGVVKLMSPAPARMHQRISSELIYQIKGYLRHKRCSVYHAPFDVRLPKANQTADDAIYTVVQPDICIVCDPAKLDDRGCIGAPEFIAEIVSPGSASRDIKEKFEVYQKSSVLEYWIVRPEEKSVEVFLLSEYGKYELDGIYTDTDKVPVRILNNELEIDLAEVFFEQ